MADSGPIILDRERELESFVQRHHQNKLAGRNRQLVREMRDSLPESSIDRTNLAILEGRHLACEGLLKAREAYLLSMSEPRWLVTFNRTALMAARTVLMAFLEEYLKHFELSAVSQVMVIEIEDICLDLNLPASYARALWCELDRHCAKVIAEMRKCRQRGPVSKESESAEAKKLIRRLREDGIKETSKICWRLDAAGVPTPRSTKWRHLTWGKAYQAEKHQSSVKAFISRALHPQLGATTT